MVTIKVTVIYGRFLLNSILVNFVTQNNTKDCKKVDKNQIIIFLPDLLNVSNAH